MDKKTVLLVAIAGLGLLLWTSYLGPKLDETFGFAPQPIEVTETEDNNSPETLDDPVNKTGEAKSLDNNPVETDKEDKGESTTETAEKVEKVEELSFKPLPLETISHDEYSLIVDPQRGIMEADLKNYKEDDRTSDVRMGSTIHPSFYLTGVVDSWKLGKPTVSKTGTSLEIRRSVIGQNLDIVQTITLSDNYQFTKTFKFINKGETPLKIEGLGINLGSMSPLSENVGMMAGMDQAVDGFEIEEEGIATKLFQDAQKVFDENETQDIELKIRSIDARLGNSLIDSQKALLYKKALVWNRTKNIDPKASLTALFANQTVFSDKQVKVIINEFNALNNNWNVALEKPPKGFQWLAVKNRYFAWIAELEQGFNACQIKNNFERKANSNEEDINNNYNRLVTAVGFVNDFSIPAGSSQEIVLDCYAGPQLLSILDELDHNKKGVMQLNLFMWMKVGWIGMISEWMLKALLMFYGFVGNYGLAIIMLTIIVKALFWRITNKSTQSMKKMSTLSPKIKELNEKYKDNPQVKQQKIMELYREAGVNPVAGCLPLFLQMPVFIALFNGLRGAIELRHSEFLWVADLSQPDTIFEIAGLPIRPLAIAWATSMFLQQKLVPSTADETQKRIMMFMPIVMLFICYGMPSGLTLYWTFSTFMSILQYYLNNKKASADEAESAAKAATTG